MRTLRASMVVAILVVLFGPAGPASAYKAWEVELTPDGPAPLQIERTSSAVLFFANRTTEPIEVTFHPSAPFAFESICPIGSAECLPAGGTWTVPAGSRARTTQFSSFDIAETPLVYTLVSGGRTVAGSVLASKRADNVIRSNHPVSESGLQRFLHYTVGYTIFLSPVIGGMLIGVTVIALMRRARRRTAPATAV